jgi:hypothetical protein
VLATPAFVPRDRFSAAVRKSSASQQKRDQLATQQQEMLRPFARSPPLLHALTTTEGIQQL